MGRAIAIVLVLAALALVGFSLFGPKSPASGSGPQSLKKPASPSRSTSSIPTAST